MIIIKRVFHIIKRILVAILILFLLTVLIFLIPGVQTYTAKKITQNINDKYHTQINIDKLKIGINARVKLENSSVLDHKSDTLINLASLSTSIFNLSNFIYKNNLDLSGTEIDGLSFNLVRYKNEKSDNFTQFLQKFESKQPKENNQAFKLHIDDMFLINSKFRVVDYNLENPESFSLSDLSLDLENINIVDDNISAKVNALSGQTGYGIEIRRLQTKFFMNSNQMRLDQMLLSTSESELATDLIFTFKAGDWNDFENKVNISAKFRQATISTTDLNHFYKGFGLNEKLSFSGNFKGNLNFFEIEDMLISGIQRSRISGDIVFNDVTNSEKFRFDTQNIDITTNYFDLKRLLPQVLGDNLPEFIKNLGNFNLKGTTFLNGQDLGCELDFYSAEGLGAVALNIQDINYSETVKYEGSLEVDDLNLGKLTQNTKLGLSSFNINVKGQGFKAKSLNTKVKGKINNIDINNYNYKAIEIDGNLKYPIFDGKLVSLDPNFLFDFEGIVDASQTQYTFDFKSNIKYADLYKLNFIRKDSISVFKGNVEIDLKANSIDDAVGQINFKNFYYKNSYDVYNFEDFVLDSKLIDGNHQISLNSPDVISGRVTGNFKPSSLAEFVSVSLRNLYFKNVIDDRFDNNSLSFEFGINNKIVEAFFPDVSIAPNTFLNGNISSDEDEIKIRFVSPKIRYQKNILNNVEIQVDKQNPFFDTYIKASTFENEIYPISNLNLINVNLNDTLFFRTEFDGGSTNQDKYELSFYQTYDDNDNTIVGLQRSSVNFKNKTWEINKTGSRNNNRIQLDAGLQNFSFDSIMLTHKNQSIKLNGIMRDSTYKDINLKLKQVELNNITPYIDSLDLQGLVDGDIHIYEKDNQYAPNLQVNIEDFEVNALKYGKLTIVADGNKDLSDFKIESELSNNQQKILSAKGNITSTGRQQNIDLNLDLNTLDISSLSPLGKDVISNIRGKIDGKAKLFGSLSNPDFSGELILKDAGLKIPYLNIDFDIEQNAKINLEEKRFVFPDVQLTDTKYKTKGLLSGFISHNYFQSWDLNLNLDSDNILTLDTPYSEESLYFGTAFISGSASITGPTSALEIFVDAKSNPNTVFKIPLSDTETIGDSSFIYFLTPEDKQKKAEGKAYIFDEISGLSMVFDLEINNDAFVEVIVDQESGSLLRGRGNGNLKIEINTNGKFDMYGDFLVQTGEYIYKYQGLIEKKFEVIPGGYISWDGNPLDANMDIKAKYTTDANPAMLLENPTVNREIPVDVIITLNGQLMQPDIQFDLEYPNLSSTVKSELDYRIQGQENEEIQALSLVALGTFYGGDGVVMNTVSGNLVAERVTSIFDQLLKDEDGEFSIGFDYVQAERTPTQNAVGSDRVGMTLQTQLSDKIFINGRFGVPVGGQTQSFVFGDVEINFLLNESGSLRAQMFNRESNIQFIGEELGYTQGVGILYTVDFETFDEFLRKMLNKNTNNKKKNNQKNKNNSSLVPSYIVFPNGQ